MRAAALILLSAGLGAAQPGSISGTVVDQARSRPLAGVHIRLYKGEILQSATEAYGAMTDADGRFSVSTIPPGTYTVELEYAGFVPAPGGGFMHRGQVVIHRGEHISDKQLGMLPLIPIAGRVVNPYGDPVPGTQVLADNGTSVHYFGPFSQSATDERGRFRLFVTPGKYYVIAGPPGDAGPSGPAEIRTDGTFDQAYAKTYYPGAADPGSASLVEAKAGSNVTGVEIQLRTTTARSDLTVAGVVTGLPPGAEATVAYSWGDSPRTVQIGSRTTTDADGRFSFQNLAVGDLRLMAQVFSEDMPLQSDVVDLRLVPPGTTDLQLALTPGGSVTGTLEVVGGDAAAVAGKLTVELFPMQTGFSMGPASGTVGGAGDFRIVSVTPEPHGVRVDGLPEDAYVKAILLDGVPSDGNLDFLHGVRGPRLKIVVGLDGAQISGELRGGDGGPPLNERTLVFLDPEPGKIVLGAPFTAIAGSRYELKGIPPGKYKLFAADPAQFTVETKPAFLAAAETVEVTDGGRVIRNLKILEAPGEKQ